MSFVKFADFYSMARTNGVFALSYIDERHNYQDLFVTFFIDTLLYGQTDEGAFQIEEPRMLRLSKYDHYFLLMYSPEQDHMYKTVIGDSYFRKNYGVDLKRAVWIARQVSDNKPTGKLTACEAAMQKYFRNQAKTGSVSPGSLSDDEWGN